MGTPRQQSHCGALLNMAPPPDLVRFFHAESSGLRRFLRSFGRLVSPDDIAQDAFLKLCAADARQIVSPRAFLFQTAKNMAVDALRRQKAAPYRAVASIDLVPTAAHAPSAEDHCIAAEEAAAVRAAIAALPELERKALLMRRVELLPPAEIATALGVSERQVQRLVLKAIAFCHARLTAADDGASAP
jgi:RNA polymerase sigma factor (sigma-70 family)